MSKELSVKSILEAHPLVKERFKKYISNNYSDCDLEYGYVILDFADRTYTLSNDMVIGILISFAISEGYWISIVMDDLGDEPLIDLQFYCNTQSFDKKYLAIGSFYKTHQEAYLSAFEAFSNILETKLKEDEL